MITLKENTVTSCFENEKDRGRKRKAEGRGGGKFCGKGNENYSRQRTLAEAKQKGTSYRLLVKKLSTIKGFVFSKGRKITSDGKVNRSQGAKKQKSKSRTSQPLQMVPKI